MQSTDHNLNNPNVVDIVDLLRNVGQVADFKVENVTQDFYDHMGKHDPRTAYVIDGDPSGKVYYGDLPAAIPASTRMKYFIGQERPDEWIIFVNERRTFTDNDSLVSVCRFDNPQSAIDALAIYNRVGSHSTLNLEIYNILLQYMNEEISICACIIGILSALGYKDDPMLQGLIQFVTAYGGMIGQSTDKGKPYFQHDLPKLLREKINVEHVSPTSTDLIGLFGAFYNVMMMHGIIQIRKRDEEIVSPNLSGPVDKIVRYYIAHKIGNKA